MASGSLSVRLSEEVLAQLTDRANAENKKVSDLVREFIESGLQPGGSADNSVIMERVDKLEQMVSTLLGVGDASVITRLDAVNADFWQANEVLVSYLSKAIEMAAEARYFARVASMWGMDVAHYVAQKTEIGVKPKPPDSDENSKRMALYEQKSKEFAQIILSQAGNDEQGKSGI